MGELIHPVGWLDEPKPRPVTADASSGWREYNSATLDGAVLGISSRLPTHSYQLQPHDINSDFYDIDKLFCGYDHYQGWFPR